MIDDKKVLPTWAAALQAKYPQPTSIAREARNRVCLDGHLNKAPDDIMGCNGIGGPDAMFNLLGSLAGKAIDIALDLASPPLPPQGGEQADLIESVARAIYEQWSAKPGYVAWTHAGNSDKQDDARRIARAAVSPQGGEQTEMDNDSVDGSWNKFNKAISDGPGSPFPGMAKAFENYYSQQWEDRDWRNETSIWAAAWKSALTMAVLPKADGQTAIPAGYRLQPISEFDAYADVLRQINNLEKENARLKNEIAAVLPQGAEAKPIYQVGACGLCGCRTPCEKYLAAAPTGLGEAKAVAPEGLIERLCIHATDTTNTAFARSTMRDAIAYFAAQSLPPAAESADGKDAAKKDAERVADLEKAIKSALCWVESAHCPTIRDEVECGRMVYIRLHALADLYEAMQGEKP